MRSGFDDKPNVQITSKRVYRERVEEAILGVNLHASWTMMSGMLSHDFRREQSSRT